FALLLEGVSEPVGLVHLRLGGEGDGKGRIFPGNLGYSIDEPFRGRGYALRACRLVLPMGKSFGVKSPVITRAPDNPASQRICQKLGARLVEVRDLPEDSEPYSRGQRKTCWHLLTL